MRIFVLVLVVFLSGYAQSKSDDSGPIFIDGAKSTAKPPNTKTVASRGEDDEVSGSGVMGDASGGSGEESSAKETTTVDVSVVSPSAKVSATTVKQEESRTPSTLDNHIPSTDKSKKEPTKKKATTINNGIGDMNAYGGGVGKSQNEDEDEAAEKREFQVLTTEVVAAIVVGAVCAIILIAFLVYRLRKRDEGSYALTDGGYNDTYKLRGEGKEAFV